MTLEEKAHEYVINNVCNNCSNCQSKGYIGCDKFRFAKKAYIDGHNDGADEDHYGLPDETIERIINHFSDDKRQLIGVLWYNK